MAGSSGWDGSKLKGVNLYLIGMMGCGKTTVGKVLAQGVGYQFLDTDQLVEQVSGQTIPEIFTEQGEKGFRDLEAEVLAQVSPFPRLVVATGGGIVLRRLNWSYLHHGVVIWLDAATEVLLKRLRSERSRRPLLSTPDPETTLRHLLEQRRPLYAQADVHVSIQAGEGPTQVANRVWTLVERRLKPEVQGSGPDTRISP